MSEVEFNMPTETRLEVDEQWPILRGEHLMPSLRFICARFAAWASGLNEQLLAEEVEDLIEGLARWGTGFVDEVLGENRVRVMHDCGRVGGGVVKLDGNECVAELVTQVPEAVGGDASITLEAKPQHLKVFSSTAVLHDGEVIW